MPWPPRISDCQRALIEAEHRIAYERKPATAHRKAVHAARKVVAIWNGRQKAGVEVWFYPTIGAAIAAGYPWLSFYCPACAQVAEVDLRKIDRHHGTTIGSLIPALSCKRCRPNAPLAKLIGLRGGNMGHPPPRDQGWYIDRLPLTRSSPAAA